MRKRQSSIEQCFTCETFFVKSHLRQCVYVSKRERDEMSVLGASKLNSNALFFWFVFGFHFRFFRRKTRASHIRSLFFWSTFHLHLSRYIMHFKSDSDVDARTIRSTLVLFELRLILPFFHSLETRRKDGFDSEDWLAMPKLVLLQSVRLIAFAFALVHCLRISSLDIMTSAWLCGISSVCIKCISTRCLYLRCNEWINIRCGFVIVKFSFSDNTTLSSALSLWQHMSNHHRQQQQFITSCLPKNTKMFRFVRLLVSTFFLNFILKCIIKIFLSFSPPLCFHQRKVSKDSRTTYQMVWSSRCKPTKTKKGGKCIYKSV